MLQQYIKILTYLEIMSGSPKNVLINVLNDIQLDF